MTCLLLYDSMELYVSTCSIKPRVILIDSLRELANSKPLFVLLMLMLEILDHMYRAYLLNNPFFLNLWNVKFCSGEQCNPWQPMDSLYKIRKNNRAGLFHKISSVLSVNVSIWVFYFINDLLSSGYL